VGRRNKAHGDALRAVGSRVPTQPIPTPFPSPVRGDGTATTPPRPGPAVPPPHFGGWAGGEGGIGSGLLIPRFAEPHRGLYSAAPYGAGPAVFWRPTPRVEYDVTA